jgi:hypothetical protein
MRNKYADVCYRCGGKVEAGEGHFEYQNFPGVKWPQFGQIRSTCLVQHATCAIKYRGTDTHYLYKPAEVTV